MSGRTALAMLVCGLLLAGLVGVSAVAGVGQREADKGALFGVLAGKNEVGQDGKKGVGDRDGRGSATAIVDGDRLCFGLTVKNVDKPQAAHIHRGTKGKNGPIVVPLKSPGEGDPGAASGCATVSSSDSRALLKNPHKFYWNIHTQDFPAGAVRGQVFAKGK